MDNLEKRIPNNRKHGELENVFEKQWASVIRTEWVERFLTNKIRKPTKNMQRLRQFGRLPNSCPHFSYQLYPINSIKSDVSF